MKETFCLSAFWLSILASLAFPPLYSGAMISTPAFSRPAFWCREFHSRLFHSCIFDALAFSTPAFSVAPLLTTPLLRRFVIHMLGLDIAYLCTKFDHRSFSRSRDMVGAHQNLNGTRDLTSLLSEMVCRSRASTCYRQPIYKILSPQFHTVRRPL